MIRHTEGKPQRVRELIAEEDARWLEAADAWAEKLRPGEIFQADGPEWSRVKVVYMRLQHYKCGYCDSALPRELAGKVAQDVDHFRPKNALKAWPKAKRGEKSPYAFSTGGEGQGYAWLAYHPQNYVVACKRCNSGLKLNYFPIAGRRATSPKLTLEEIDRLEKPYLLYPLGEHDDDPEDIITFEGAVAKPKRSAGHEHRRAIVTIEFFGLNHDELVADRCRAITELWSAFALEQSAKTEDARRIAGRQIEGIVADSAPQAACARCYLSLIRSDLERAWNFYTLAVEFRAPKRK
jgi:hypothetical protein